MSADAGITYYLNIKEYTWYYDVRNRVMQRITPGSEVEIYSNMLDDHGRIVVTTKNGDYILVPKEDISTFSNH